MNEEEERVILTEENLKTVAKRTGRREYDLQKILSEAQARGGTASIRLKERK